MGNMLTYQELDSALLLYKSNSALVIGDLTRYARTSRLLSRNAGIISNSNSKNTDKLEPIGCFQMGQISLTERQSTPRKTTDVPQD